MSTAISLDLLASLASHLGYMEQLDLPFTDAPAILEIDTKYCTSVYTGITVTARGNRSRGFSEISHSDHPAFTKLRNWLEDNNYISTNRNWSNGDTVIAPFYLNKVLFDVDTRFPCASAITFRLDNPIN